jgi:hypothetical protein
MIKNMLKKAVLFFVFLFSINCFAQQIIDWDVQELTAYYLYTAELDDGVEIRAATDDLSPQKLFVNFIGFDPNAVVRVSFINGTNIKLDNQAVLSGTTHVVNLPHMVSFNTVSLTYSYELDGVVLYETEELNFGVNPVSEHESLNKFNLYPNPTIDGNVFIEIPESFNQDKSKLEVFVFSSDSRQINPEFKLGSDNLIQLNLGDQAPGFYLVLLKVEDKIFKTKIIKN